MNGNNRTVGESKNMPNNGDNNNDKGGQQNRNRANNSAIGAANTNAQRAMNDVSPIGGGTLGQNHVDDDSLDDIERQIQMIENAHARSSVAQGNGAGTRQNVSMRSDYSGSEVDVEGDHVNDDAMFNAIVASLVDYTGNEPNEEDKKAVEKETIQLKEVMVLSKLEDDKKTGKLNLDFLKKGKK